MYYYDVKWVVNMCGVKIDTCQSAVSAAETLLTADSWLEYCKADTMKNSLRLAIRTIAVHPMCLRQIHQQSGSSFKQSGQLNAGLRPQIKV